MSRSATVQGSKKDNTTSIKQSQQKPRPRNTQSKSGSQLHCPALPWQTRILLSDPLCLHKEILDFCNYIAPTAAERDMRIDVIQRVSSTITDLWPDSQVQVYGSFASDVYLPYSDIDFVVDVDVEDSTAALFVLASQFCSRGFCATEGLAVLPQARVPIIHFIDSKSGCGVDINFKTHVGLSHTTLIKDFIERYSCLKPLLLILKYFLHQRGLNHPYTGGIGSYGLTLMLVSFLQNQKELQKDEVEPDIGDLLMKFFLYYGNDFDFSRSVISFRTNDNGLPISKKDIPEWWATPWIPVVEDPLLPGNNVIRAAFRIVDIKSEFYDAYVCLRVKTSMHCTPSMTNVEPILGSIIFIPDDLIQYRYQVQLLYGDVSQSVTEVELSRDQPHEKVKSYRNNNSNSDGSNNNNHTHKKQNKNRNKNSKTNHNPTNTESERNFKNPMKKKRQDVQDTKYKEGEEKACLVEAS